MAMDRTEEQAQTQKTSLTKSLGLVVATARQDGLSCRDAFLVVSMLAAELAAQGVPAADIAAMSSLLARLAGHRA
jgi:hypothetical protein